MGYCSLNDHLDKIEIIELQYGEKEKKNKALRFICSKAMGYPSKVLFD